MQEIIDLHEAYASIYTPVEYLQESYEVEEPQYISEEVILASQYFCEMGLNEIGVEILIEELGLDQFVDFVYDIAEEYYLTEARSRGERIEPRLSSGKPIKGKPKAASLKSLRKKKAARQEAEEKASAEKPSGLKASLQRQSAIADAAKKQPKKPGLLDRVAGAVISGIERHNQANKNLNKNLSKVSKAASEVGGLLGNVGRRVGGVAREFGSGASGTARLAGRVASKGLGEEVEYWVNSLVEEGYDLSQYTWDDMYEIYLDEMKMPKEGPASKMVHGAAGAIVKGADWVRKGPMRHRLAVAAHDERKRQKKIPYAALTAESYNLSENRTRELGDRLRDLQSRSERTDREAGEIASRARSEYDDLARQEDEFRRGVDAFAAATRPKPKGKRKKVHEQFDSYDIILDYLLDEGYADTIDDALVIMANMSEEWKYSIIEGTVVTTTGEVNPPIKPGPIFPGRPFVPASRPFQDPWINPNGATGARAPRGASRTIKKDTTVA